MGLVDITTRYLRRRRAASALQTDIATTEPAWKRWVRRAFFVLFFLVWLDQLAFFYLRAARLTDGSPISTATHSVLLKDHERVVYITPAQDQLLNTLDTYYWKAGPVVILSAIVLHNLLGVRLFTRDDGDRLSRTE